MRAAASPAAVAVRARFPRLEELDEVAVARIAQLAPPRSRQLLHVLLPSVCVFLVWWLIAEGLLYLPVRDAHAFGAVTGALSAALPIAAFLVERARFRRCCLQLGVDRRLLREIERRFEGVDRLGSSGAAREQALVNALTRREATSTGGAHDAAKER